MFSMFRRPGPRTANESGPPAASPAAISRRRALVAAVAIPLSSRSSQSLADPNIIAGETLVNLIQRTEAQASAFMRGDMEQWSGSVRIADDFTLMQPFGGEASHGFDSSHEHLAQLARYFRNGDAKLELAQSYASDDLVVLVMIERQHGEVGGLPDQDWSLRVTQVYRKRGSEWQLVHRHADPMVRHVGLKAAASLARGAA